MLRSTHQDTSIRKDTALGLRPYSFLHKSWHRNPGIRRRQGAGSREHNIGSVMACPVLLSQQMGGAADDHLHDIQWLQGSVSSSYMLSL